MFIELIDLLRCPVEHEDSWLVAAFTKMEGRFVIEGKLGCPVCTRSFPVEGGIANFSNGDSAALPEVEANASRDEAVRYAAMLGLTRPGSLVAMIGPAAAHAEAVASMTESRVIAINPPSRAGEHERVGVVLARGRIPLAPASADGIVLDDGTNASVGEALRVLKPGGRIVAPASARLDGRFRELARDHLHVVAESAGQLVKLSR